MGDACCIMQLTFIMLVAGRCTRGGGRVEGRRGPARKLLHHGRGLPAVLAGAQTPGPGACAGLLVTLHVRCQAGLK